MDYIDLQIILTGARTVHDKFIDKEFDKINSAMSSLTEDTASKLNFIYSEGVEGILETDFDEVLAEFARGVHEDGEISLEEAISFVTLAKTADCDDVKEDDLENMKDIFGEEGFDIPESNDGAYRVAFNATGRGNVIKCIRNLQKQIGSSVDIVKSNLAESIDYDELAYAMGTLLEVKVLDGVKRAVNSVKKVTKNTVNRVKDAMYNIKNDRGVQGKKNNVVRAQHDLKAAIIKDNAKKDIKDADLLASSKRHLAKGQELQGIYDAGSDFGAIEIAKNTSNEKIDSINSAEKGAVKAIKQSAKSDLKANRAGTKVDISRSYLKNINPTDPNNKEDYLKDRLQREVDTLSDKADVANKKEDEKKEAKDKLLKEAQDKFAKFMSLTADLAKDDDKKEESKEDTNKSKPEDNKVEKEKPLTE